MKTEAKVGLNPSRRFGWGAIAIVALISALLTAAAFVVARLGVRETAAQAAAVRERYQCPMHPSIVQDGPGTCPICGMNLVKVGPQAGATATAQRRVAFYRSPMDPKQTSPVPRKDEMGMDFVPVYADELASSAITVKGMATVDIDPQRQQLIGLKTTLVSEGPIGGAWRTTGRVAVDETRVRTVNVKVPGFVERIHVNYVGMRVRQGDPLFCVYSPELLSAEQELLLAVRTRDALSRDERSTLASDGDALVTAARRKLSLWDVPAREIDRLLRTGEPQKLLTLYSPVDGVVTRKDVVEGSRMDAGATPYEITDLSEVWVQADAYESELRHLATGMPATLKLQAFPERIFEGTVLFISPLLDPATRTAKVRLAFKNPHGELRPEMFGEVVLAGTARRSLQIPRDAVVDSGTQKIVFVAIGEGKFQPRPVLLGESDGVNVEVNEGLSAGERVVTRANFLIDSESRLRASLAALAPAENEKAGAR